VRVIQPRGFDKYLLLAADCVCLHSVIESIFTSFLPTLGTQQTLIPVCPYVLVQVSFKQPWILVYWI
jgi:hypothetical protein